jgi:hypothetical protein
MTMNCNYASGVRFLKIELPLILKGGRKKLAVQTDLLPKETPNPFGPVPFRAASFFLRCAFVACHHTKWTQLGNPVRFRRLSANSGFGGSEEIYLRGTLFALCCLLVVASLMGCGGSSPTLPTVTITISPSVVTLGLASEQQLTSTISGTTNSNVT